MDVSENCIPKKRTVAYMYSEECIRLCSELPKVPHRASMVHSLIASYNLLPKLKVVLPVPVHQEQLRMFHSEDYLDCLKQLSAEDDEEKHGEDADVFGLTYDCPAYYGVYEYACLMAGASLKAAQCLLMGVSDVAINWCGGWHHAKRDEASGFCYVNDAVLAILKLREKFQRIVYVDIDLHHGDGVEDAFCTTSKVLTVSFHKVSPGFFPGSGNINEIGQGRGKNYSVNVPILDGVQDEGYTAIFTKIMKLVKEVYNPDAIVCQCGADSLSEDPMGAFNLTLDAYYSCVKYLLSWNLPTLLLGGGGYNLANTAKCWTLLTGLALNEPLLSEIPDHTYFTAYGPDYSLEISPGTKTDKNSDEHYEEIYQIICRNLKCIAIST